MEFDVFVSQYQLAFEYQGAHHYSKDKVFISTEKQLTRDQMKRDECSKAGITLVRKQHYDIFMFSDRNPVLVGQTKI